MGVAYTGLAQSQALEGLVEDVVQSYLKEDATKGLSIGIIESGHIYEYGFGETSETEISRPTADLLYPLGSSTKIFTAAILMQMVQEERLSLSTPIAELLTYEFKNPTLQKLNTHLIASHRSGMPMRPQNYHLANKDPKDPFAHYTHDLSFEYLDAYRESKKNYPIGKFRFSNYNYAVLGEILCASGEQSWTELFDTYIRDKHGLSGCVADRPADLDKVIPIHTISGKDIEPLQYGVFAPSIGAYANLSSSIRFMQVWIDAVNASEWDDLQECLIEHTNTDKKHVMAGYGWFIYPRTKKKPPVYTISGKTDGSWSFFAMIPETKTAVVILSNSKHSVDQLGIELLDIINR